MFSLKDAAADVLSDKTIQEMRKVCLRTAPQSHEARLYELNIVIRAYWERDRWQQNKLGCDSENWDFGSESQIDDSAPLTSRVQTHLLYLGYLKH